MFLRSEGPASPLNLTYTYNTSLSSLVWPQADILRHKLLQAGVAKTRVAVPGIGYYVACCGDTGAGRGKAGFADVASGRAPPANVEAPGARDK